MSEEMFFGMALFLSGFSGLPLMGNVLLEGVFVFIKIQIFEFENTYKLRCYY